MFENLGRNLNFKTIIISIIVAALSCIAAVIIVFLIFFSNITITPISHHEAYLLNNRYPERFYQYVLPQAKKYNIEPELIYAIMRIESNYNPKAANNIATGLMQMTESTFLWLQDTMVDYDNKYDNQALYNPLVNIRYCSLYLNYLLKKCDNDIPTTLASYNAGPGNVEKWVEDPKFSHDGKTIYTTPFDDTNDYIKMVTNYYNRYKKLLVENTET